jgi:hypothetical protein
MRAGLQTGNGSHWDITLIRDDFAATMLVDALGNLRGLQKEGEKHLAQCMQPSVYTGFHGTPEQQENIRKYCVGLGYFRHIDELNSLILQTLAQLVKDPPSLAGAAPTPDETSRTLEPDGNERLVLFALSPTLSKFTG